MLQDLLQAEQGRFSKEFDFLSPAARSEGSPLRGKGHLFYQKRYGSEANFEALRT